MTILNCGHEPSPHSAHTTGTARTPDGAEICWSCAYTREVETLKTADRHFAYLSSDGTQITTWPGQAIARVTSLRKGRHNIGGHLYRFNAIDVHGQAWYGTTPGQGMYARMRRATARKGKG